MCCRLNMWSKLQITLLLLAGLDRLKQAAVGGTVAVAALGVIAGVLMAKKN